MNKPHSQSSANFHVTLVGAGPGDPELLTLKALREIQKATVLFVDDLVSDAIITFASPTARIVKVGKRGGCKSTPQSFIERLMITAAKQGEVVVRLKGGDPLIFGRGGEEVENLKAEGVSVSIVNGITSGLAAATALGVPLTHRNHAHGVVFVTGHANRGEADVNWRNLSYTAHHCHLTLVIYMGISGAQIIQAELLDGLHFSTPVAVVQNASLKSQRHFVGTLGNLHQLIYREEIFSPAIIIVGDVLQGLTSVANSLDPGHTLAA